MKTYLEHLLRPTLSATEINSLTRLLRKTLEKARAAPSSDLGYDLENDSDAIRPDRTKIKRAVAEWQNLKNIPTASEWQSLFFLALFAVCYPIFIAGAVTHLNQSRLPHPIEMIAVVTMTVNLPRIIREAFALFNTKLRNGFPIGTNLGREEFEEGVMRLNGDHLTVYRAGYVLKLNLNSAIGAWEHDGIIILSDGDLPFAALPARDDLKRALIRLGHLGFWGTPVEKTRHAPAPRALEVAPC